jgi:aryl-alcohol dehydrogenase-like predicted oxidoreductase
VALHQPWATIVLSGAATTAHLTSNLRATTVTLRPDHIARIADLAEPPRQYWQRRSGLAWT